jgi:hypothetical protein
MTEKKWDDLRRFTQQDLRRFTQQLRDTALSGLTAKELDILASRFADNPTALEAIERARKTLRNT